MKLRQGVDSASVISRGRDRGQNDCQVVCRYPADSDSGEIRSRKSRIRGSTGCCCQKLIYQGCQRIEFCNGINLTGVLIGHDFVQQGHSVRISGDRPEIGTCRCVIGSTGRGGGTVRGGVILYLVPRGLHGIQDIQGRRSRSGVIRIIDGGCDRVTADGRRRDTGAVISNLHGN